MPRTRVTRLVEYQVEERAELDALLDSVRVGHVGLVTEGLPVVIPTAIARDNDVLLVHGSTGSRWMRQVALGVPCCVAVTSLDGVIVARSAFESSFRYRSAVVFGSFERLEGDDKRRGLDVIVDKLIPGRANEIRPSTISELNKTMVLSLAIEQWSLKVSSGWPTDGDDDIAGDAWAGVVPLTIAAGPALPAPDLRGGISVPASVQALTTDTGSPPVGGAPRSSGEGGI
jgi:nitroimidazol reductase NimA-like FMN-containing flavoprotein (pyridoxamine 5'-phosphate oxidase superfamily)